jgi:hypothetical protein
VIVSIRCALLITVALFSDSEVAAGAPLSAVVDEALRSGADVTLPGPVAAIFGFAGDGKSVPMRQIEIRRDAAVHTFAVSPAHRHEIVISVLDGSTGISTSYLLTIAGKLRRVAQFSSPASPHSVPRSHAGAGFSSERDFWTSAQNRAPVRR